MDEVKVSFWNTNKNTIWAMLLVVFGVAGGNVDRLYEQLPDVYGVSKLTTRVEVIESKLENLDGATAKLDEVLKKLEK